MTDMQRRPGADRGDVDDLLAGSVGADDNGPVMRLWQQAVAKSKLESRARRERVLAHEDLAQRLTAPPSPLSSPQRWSGWIPPRTLPEEACTNCARDSARPICRGVPHRARVNDSPVRRQLVDIATEAMTREPGRR